MRKTWPNMSNECDLNTRCRPNKVQQCCVWNRKYLGHVRRMMIIVAPDTVFFFEGRKLLNRVGRFLIEQFVMDFNLVQTVLGSKREYLVEICTDVCRTKTVLLLGKALCFPFYTYWKQTGSILNGTIKKSMQYNQSHLELVSKAEMVCVENHPAVVKEFQA